MTCRHAQSLIEDLVDGELPEATADQIRALMAENPGCLEEFELSHRLKELLAQRTIPNPGEEYFTELQRLILARTAESALFAGGLPHEQERRSVRSSFVRSLVTLAASLLIFITAVFYGSADHTDMAEEQSAVQSASLVHVVNVDSDIQLTADGRDRVVAGVMLLGPPGLLGRFTDMALVPDLE